MEGALNSTRSIEITVLSAENLCNGRKPLKNNTYVVVRADSNNFCATNMSVEGGCNPSWNEKVVVDMAGQARIITVEVQCKTSMGVKTVGTARVPVSDFMGVYIPENHSSFLSYRLRDHQGDKNGVINLAVRVKMPEYKLQTTQPVTGVPATEKMTFSGVVTGVPVCLLNYQQ